MNDGGNTVVDMSLSDTIYEGVFLTLIPENIFQEFYNANYAAIIVFAIAMGVACAKVLNRQQIHSSDMTFMSLLVDLDQILTIMIIWIIMLTPFGKLQLLLYYYDALSYIYIYIYIYILFNGLLRLKNNELKHTFLSHVMIYRHIHSPLQAVFSLVSATIGGETELGSLFANMGLLIACILLCYITHFLLTYCGGYFLLTKRNPFHYMRYLPPAQLLGTYVMCCYMI
jgi:Na+/H+-dicarboxylate symporter